MTHVNPSLDQAGFRGRNDDGSESAATWTATANSDWAQAVDQNFRVRFLVQETAGGTENNVLLQLQYNLNGAGWNNVTDLSSVVRASDSAHLTEGESTTQQIGAGTFITPNSGVDEVDGIAGQGNDIDFAGSDEVEVEYCCQLLAADVADQDTVQLRVVRGDGTVLESYTNTPSLTVSEGAAAQTLNGVVAAAPWGATTGALNPGAAVLGGVVAGDPWGATPGTLSPGPVTLAGVVAADVWEPRTGALSPGPATLAGVPALDAWVATTGSVSAEGGAQTLAGAVAAASWAASVGSLDPGPGTLVGVAAADVWEARIGAAVPGPSTLNGVAASGAWAASTGAVEPGGASLTGSVASVTWRAGTGSLAPGPAVLAGAVAGDAWGATKGALLAAGAGDWERGRVKAVLTSDRVTGTFGPTRVKGIWS